jgi:hypothetical protein
MKFFYLTHVHDAGDWKLRKYRAASRNHPIDPSWETGRYMKCHPDARAQLEVDQFLFDIVSVNGQGLVRSAFKISGSSGVEHDKALYFESFWFPGAKGGVVFPKKFHRTRYPVPIDEPVAQKVIEQMREAGYHEYEKGVMPSTVDSTDWNDMVREGAFKGSRSSRDQDTEPDNCSE